MKAPTTDGLYEVLDRETYDRVERVNFSTLKVLERSPAHYRHHLVTPTESTDAMTIGRVVHIACFEPDRYRNAIAVWDGAARRGKDWDKFVDRNEGRELLTENQYELVKAMSAAVRADEIVKRYLRGGRGETTMLWTYDVAGERVPCKGRLDYDSDEVHLDLKTTVDASPTGFGRQCARMSWHAQAAWYSDGYVRATAISKPYLLIAVEKAPPHIVQVYRVPEHVLQAGRDLYQGWLDQLVKCRKADLWPGYHDGEMDLVLPNWASPFDNDGEDVGGLGLAPAGDGFNPDLPAN